MLSMITLAETMPGLEHVMNLGAAGLMGAMWLWERRNSQKREQQLDEAHTRILTDRVQLGELMDVVRHNTQALMKLAAMQEQALRHPPPAPGPSSLPRMR